MKIFKHIILSVIFLLSFNLYSQNEANNWYFGDHAGISFNAGVPTAINDSAILTYEGCSSYSDAAGNLLFYTDGLTVWNRNNEPMPNGLGLKGHPSSTQSALIVPNPDNSDLFYLFTVGTQSNFPGLPNNIGFYYYTVDMTAAGGLGDVVSNGINLANGHDEEWSEKVTSVQNTSCDGFWVISMYESKFYSYLVTNTGVNTVPVISDLSNIITVTDNTQDPPIFQDRRGYLKASPGGNKLACAMQDSGMFLLDFNATTGVVSNGLELDVVLDEDNPSFAYGVEFSLNGRYLYVSTGSAGGQGSGASSSSISNLLQFEITSNNIFDINQSRNLIYTYNNARGALQLAANGKIYWASDNETFISIINNPDNVTNVDFQFQTIDLNGHKSAEGLPPFLQSLFVADLDIINDGTGILATQLDLCHGETATIGPINPAIPSNATYEWTLDGVSLGLPNNTPSLPIDEFGTYGAGFYEVEVDYLDGSCKHRGIALVTFRDNPVLNALSNLVQCDDDTDGMSTVDLTAAYDLVLASGNYTDETISFHISQNQALNNQSPLPLAYLTADTIIWVRVENRYGCTDVTQLQIDIQTPTITSFTQVLRACDDFKDINGFDNENNDDTDGISYFDFTNPDNDGTTADSVIDSVISLYPAIDQPNLEVHFYNNINDALFQRDEILNITNYRNINSPNNERIFIRVTDNTGLSCPGFGINFYIDLVVIPVPVVLLPEDQRTFNACDDNNDGLFEFDTSQLEFSILGSGQLGVTLTYFYPDLTPVAPAPNPMPNPFVTGTQTIIIRATNNILDACEEEFTITYVVDALPIVNPITNQISCDNGDNEQDGVASFDTSTIQETILGGPAAQQNMIVTYRDENLNELPSPLPDPFETSSQIITVTVDNPDNALCSATTTIEFIVNDTPSFNVQDVILCLNEEPITARIAIENPQDVYDYNWFRIENNEEVIVGSNQEFLDVTQGGDYMVIATTTDGNFCRKTTNFQVIESNIPTFDNVFTTDTTFNNSASIIIAVSGEGDYEYSLDNTNQDDDSQYQDENTFNFVSFGVHNITIRDKNGCGLITEQFVILEYLQFFTPNDDGYFETWNLTHVSNLMTTFNTVSNITIYDRHGKIMAVIDPNGEGWNGKYKGKQALATDYWFTVDLIDFNGKITTKKGHFSLRL